MSRIKKSNITQNDVGGLFQCGESVLRLTKLQSEPVAEMVDLSGDGTRVVEFKDFGNYIRLRPDVPRKRKAVKRYPPSVRQAPETPEPTVDKPRRHRRTKAEIVRVNQLNREIASQTEPPVVAGLPDLSTFAISHGENDCTMTMSGKTATASTHTLAVAALLLQFPIFTRMSAEGGSITNWAKSQPASEGKQQFLAIWNGSKSEETIRVTAT